ncbi:hypothetical protein [Shewanella mangrovisoli]
MAANSQSISVKLVFKGATQYTPFMRVLACGGAVYPLVVKGAISLE